MIDERMDLYVIGIPDHGLYKIGVSKDVAHRRRDLQMGCPVRLIIVSQTAVLSRPFSIEKYVHKVFQANRIHGEWFKLSKAEANTVPRLVVSHARTLASIVHAPKVVKTDALPDNWREYVYCRHHSVMNCVWCRFSGDRP
jgi:hypothetical protein